MTLLHDLQQHLGAAHVDFSHMARLLYSTDASNYQIVPIGVTFPRTVEDVIAIHETAAQHNVPLLPRGGGSSLAGQTVGEAIVMDFSRYMRRVRSIHAEAKTVIVEPGVVLGNLNQQLASMGLMFGPDPASAERANIGGCIGNNATGAHSILYGMTADNIVRLEVVLASGERTWLDANTPTLNAIRETVGTLARTHADEIQNRFPKTFRTVAGYALNKIDPDAVNLNWLLAGSEGTLATIVGAELKLVDRPTAQQKRLAMVHFDTLAESLQLTPRILETDPSAIELMDRFLTQKTREHPEFSKSLTFVDGDPAAILITEYYGDSESELDHKIGKLTELLKRVGHQGKVTYAKTAQEQKQVWTVRKAGLGLLMSERRPDKPIAFIEDAAVPVEHLADYVKDVEDIIHQAGTDYAIYAHASAGCLHIRPLIDLKTETGRRQYREIGDAVAETVTRYNGTITGEHGKGLARGEHNATLFGDTLMGAFKDIKTAFDPHNRMNPGKIIDPTKMDDPATLRYTPAYEIIPLQTRFDWESDGGWSGAVEMCNGAGVCRKEGTGTMCPSYMGTRDEAHSTRGRANALRMAMSGKLPDGMADESLKAVYDLCLACKACSAECPSSVDVAKMKSEFLAQYHDAKGIPLTTRLFGNIHQLNKLGALMPAISNWGMNSIFGKLAFKLIGMPTERPLPKFAARRFSAQGQRHHTTPAATLVIDTFTEYNHPEVGIALLKVADRLGLALNTIRLSESGCCGRPAISKGLLDQGKRMAEQNVRFLAQQLGAAPFVFLEPSCLSAILDEYPSLVGQGFQVQAQQIADNSLSAEAWLLPFLQDADLEWKNPPSEILLHGHCHQKSLWGTSETLELLACLPDATVTEIDSGCCGVAGSFGYEHYDLSMTIGEQRLLPAIREATGATVAAPGTSCRAQIHDAGLAAQHPIEVIAACL